MSCHNLQKNSPIALGFSLVEMAVVLTIVGVLLAGLLPTLSSQVEQQRRNETRKQMEEIKEALIGYAIINGALPCPTTQTDPTNAGYGVAAATCTTSITQEGYLPWKTLGLSETDVWGIKRTGTASPWLGYFRYRVEPSFAVPFTLATTSNATLDLQVRDTAGNRLTNTTERPVAIFFSTGPNKIPDGGNASYEATTSATYQADVPNPIFDDLTLWISRPTLFNRLVMAGKLP